MNNLIIDIDLDNHTISQTDTGIDNLTNCIQFKVTKNKDLTSFNLSVNINSIDGVPSRNIEIPAAGTMLITTDLDVLQFVDHIFIPDKQYVIDVLYSYEGNTYQNTFNFTGTRPPKPFNSWTWDGQTWRAPVELPPNAGDISKGELYTWDEDNLAWVPLGGYTVE